MQLVHEDVDWLTISTTEALSQKSMILSFSKYSFQVSTATVKANNSRYSIEGLHCLMNHGSHCP